MTRLHLTLPFLASVLPLRAWAGPVPSNPELIQRFNYLQDLPGCAFDCVVQFAQDSFSSCSSSDLPCLCRSNSQSGFTLGEGALRCLVSDCQGASTFLLEAAYAVCADVYGAKPETHATIEASMASSVTIQLTAETAAVTTPWTITTSSSSTPTSTSHRPAHTTTSTTETIVLDTSFSMQSGTMALGTSFPTPSFSALTFASTASASATQAANPPPIAANEAANAPMLNKGQIAGVAVAGTIISAIAIGLLFCLFRSKKGKKRRDSDTSFGLQGDYRTPRIGSQAETQETSVGVAPKARQFLGIPSNPAQKRWSLWRAAMKKGGEGDDVSLPDPDRHIAFDGSPVSVQSYHTTSRLLPDKPSIAMPSMLASAMAGASRQRQENPGQTPSSKQSTPKQPVRFAPNVGLRLITPTPPPSQGSSSSGGSGWQVQNTSQNALQNHNPPPLRHQLSDPFIDKTETSALLAYASDRQGRRASNRDLPRIITPDTRQQQQQQQQQQQGAAPHPSQYPSQHAPHPGAAPPYAHPRDGARDIVPFVSPRPHTPSSAPDAPGPAGSYSQLPSEDESSYFSKWKPLRRASKTANRPLTHYTTGSDTSFEDDDVSPPVALVSTLSPVAESPVRRGNFAAVAAAAAAAGRGTTANTTTTATAGPSSTAASSVYYPPVPGSTPSAKRLQITPQKKTAGGPNTRTAAAALAAAAAAAAAAGPAPPARYTPPPPPPPPTGWSPVEMPDSSPDVATAGARRSPRSPNFSRPEPYAPSGGQAGGAWPQRYMDQTPPPPPPPPLQQHQLPPKWQQQQLQQHQQQLQQQRQPQPQQSPKWQVQMSPGLDGSQETWASPIDERRIQRQPPRPGIVQVGQGPVQRPVQPPAYRGPWRGKNPPIGSQWLR